MTTHNVQIRRIRNNGMSETAWHTLTRSPISKRDADNLVTILGDGWEGRVVALEAPLGEPFAELERLMSLRRWEKIHVNHHPDCPATADDVEWHKVDFGDRPSDRMTGAEWLALKQLEVACTSVLGSSGVRTANVQRPRVHEGVCEKCSARARALSVTVTIATKDGITSGREYAL